jgi:hypothetical protein
VQPNCAKPRANTPHDKKFRSSFSTNFGTLQQLYGWCLPARRVHTAIVWTGRSNRRRQYNAASKHGEELLPMDAARPCR